MRELDFRTYAVERIPAAFASVDVDADTRRAAVVLLASKLSELADDRGAMNILRGTPLLSVPTGTSTTVTNAIFAASVWWSASAGLRSPPSLRLRSTRHQ